MVPSSNSGLLCSFSYLQPIGQQRQILLSVVPGLVWVGHRMCEGRSREMKMSGRTSDDTLVIAGPEQGSNMIVAVC